MESSLSPRLPRGPRGPGALYTLEFMLWPERFIKRMRASYGDTFRVRGLGFTGLGVCTPELAKEVFATDPEAFGAFAVGMKGIVGAQSLFSTFSSVHKKQRRLLNPRFHGQRTRTFAKTMQEVTRSIFAKVGRGTQVSMLEVGQAISLDVINETVFGSGGVDRERVGEIVRSMLEDFSPVTVFSESLQTTLFPPWRRFVKRQAKFNDFVTDTLRARRARSEPGDDILGLLIEARYEDGGALSDEEIRDHLVTILIAGHETTAIAIAWGTYWLLREPKVAARLRDELATLGSDPQAEAFAKLEYLGAVCDETLRIRPIVTDVVRPVVRDVRIGEWTVRAGEMIVVFVQSMLTDPVIFSEPHAFRPERFIGKRYAATEFLPFGGGHRRCLGAAFAEQEMRIVLGTLMKEHDLALASDEPERSKRRNVTMGPAEGVRVEWRS